MIKPKQIGRAPILGRPRLFGGKILDYIQVTQQEIPLIISSCVSAINRLGLHNQVRASLSLSFGRNIFVVLFFFFSSGNLSCSRCPGGSQSVQRSIRERRRSVDSSDQSRHEFGRRSVEVVLSRTERTVGQPRDVRSVRLVHS